jgi:hypothetical protein
MEIHVNPLVKPITQEVCDKKEGPKANVTNTTFA